jgi:simple sugar transport system ATP-binding protein
MNELLRLNAITKTFGPVRALNSVNLTVGKTEVLGLIGDNGAGKSTLVKILSGVFPPDSGSMSFQGEEISFKNYSAVKSRLLGIETVHQDRSLGDKQPLWRNVFVGRHLRDRLGFIRVAQEKKETIRLLHDVIGLPAESLDPESPASVLSGGERQGLAIARAMHFQSRLIILDEPTTALSLRETAKVLGFIRKIKEAGNACIFITHNIAQVYAVAERFVILDRGGVAADIEKSRIDEAGLTDMLMSLSRPEESHA